MTENSDKRSMQIDAELVRQLAQLLAEGDLSEIEVEDGQRRIRLKRKIELPSAPSIPSAPPAPAPAAAAPAPMAAAQAPAPAEHPGAVKSPMVGTAYLSSAPGAAPFVTIGNKVSAGDTLLIVEAMKVMNAITATQPGTVKQILIQDGQPVEYDQPLVIVE